ncbi:MAG: hypothetical protein OEL89_05325 [Candidatus Peregrinibacteria bacterium]|nr:hypothetical protein [Candidatus Peregrinibacteria bacterium]
MMGRGQKPKFTITIEYSGEDGLPPQTITQTFDFNQQQPNNNFQMGFSHQPNMFGNNQQQPYGNRSGNGNTYV